MPDISTTTAESDSDPRAPTAVPERIVFFDGVCGLCNHTVDFLLRRDVRGILRFAPLQGSTATQVLPPDVRDRLDTMAYYRLGQPYYRSTAVLWILQDLGGFWGAIGTLLRIVPAWLRDVGYRGVSLLRYRIFGKHEVCRIPSSEERARFLE